MQKISITWTISTRRKAQKNTIENQQVVMEEENAFVWNSKNNDHVDVER